MTFITLAILRRYKTFKTSLLLSTLSIICRRISITLSWISQEENRASSEHQFESYLHTSSAEEAIMIHEKIVFKKKQSVETKLSNRSMKETRRKSIIFTNEIKNEFDAISTSYHIQNLDQLKYWFAKNEVSIVTTWTNMRNEHVAFFNQLNKKINEINELTKNYNIQTSKLHDAIFIIRELRVEQRERNVEAINSNTLLFIIEDDVIVFTFKKLFDSSVFIDEKNLIIDDWLSIMRNKLKENANWFLTNVQQKAYVRIKINDDVMKHFISRFFKNSIKSYNISKEIFDDLYQIFDDSNRRINALKTYRRLKQIESFKDFNTFWTKFQRLANDSELYNQEALLEDLKDKMFYELQKTLTIESYKATDFHEFVKMCRYTNQILRDVKNSLMMLNVKKSSSSLIRIKSIRTSIDRFLVLDLKFLNSNLNRIFALLLNHQKIRWTISIVTIVKNRNTFLETVVNSKRWILITSYVRWMCMKRMIHRVKRIILSSTRKKINSHQIHNEERAWCQSIENWCVQLRR